MVFEKYSDEQIMKLMARNDFWQFVNYAISTTDDDRKRLHNLRNELAIKQKNTPNLALECSLKIENDPDNWEVYWNEYLNKTKPSLKTEITIQIPQSRIIATVGPKEVDANGRISVGREHINKNVIAYVVEVDKT